MWQLTFTFQDYVSEITELQTNTYHISTSKLCACLLKTLLQIKRQGGAVMSFGPCGADLPRASSGQREGPGRDPAGPCEPGLGRPAARAMRP